MFLNTGDFSYDTMTAFLRPQDHFGAFFDLETTIFPFQDHIGAVFDLDTSAHPGSSTFWALGRVRRRRICSIQPKTLFLHP